MKGGGERRVDKSVENDEKEKGVIKKQEEG